MKLSRFDIVGAKRVILYRKAGTPIHFDLAAYNCPEYSNMMELETLLTKRLTALTGRHLVSHKLKTG